MWVIDRGYGFLQPFDVQKADGSAEEVSGTLATWKLAQSETAAAALLTKADLSPASVSAKTIVSIELSGAETELLAPGQYYHQLAVALSGGTPRIYFKGWLTVKDRL